MDPSSPRVNGCASLVGSAENDDLCPNKLQETKRDLDDSGTVEQSALENPPKRPFYFPRDAKVTRFSGFGLRESTGNTFGSLSSFSPSSPDTRLLSGIDIGFFPTRGRVFDPSEFTFGFGGSDSAKKEEKKCGSCRRRVGLLGFKCRCRKVFCGKHRYPEEHGCSFDHKSFGRQILQQQNPVIESDKLENRI